MTNYDEVDFNHLDRMQRRVMIRECWYTEKEFREHSSQEQQEYYRWLKKQCGELADLI
jgi:hypothetical protein